MFTSYSNLRFLTVRLLKHDADQQKAEADQEEFRGLVLTFGGEIIIEESQNESRRDAATYIGKGKARELALTITDNDIDVVAVNDNLRTSQLYNLAEIFKEGNPDIQVWDRTDLILHIFEKHAVTAEAKLQIKLATVQHMGPELHGMGLLMSQQGAGIGTRGMGETNTEIMKRHWRLAIKEIEKQLDKVKRSRQQQMENRKKIGSKTVSIIGYTNAGKTTLFNLLTHKENLVENAPFATLDSSVGSVYLPKLKTEAFVTDTIGFVENLPHTLIQAFSSTLMETIQADLLLHIIDVSDPMLKEKVAVVENILKDMELDMKNQIFVFNKIDKMNPAKQADLIECYQSHNPQFLNAKTGEGYQTLLNSIEKALAR